MGYSLHTKKLISLVYFMVTSEDVLRAYNTSIYKEHNTEHNKYIVID
jgi:hypothetical protein